VRAFEPFFMPFLPVFAEKPGPRYATKPSFYRTERSFRELRLQSPTPLYRSCRSDEPSCGPFGEFGTHANHISRIAWIKSMGRLGAPVVPGKRTIAADLL